MASLLATIASLPKKVKNPRLFVKKDFEPSSNIRIDDQQCHHVLNVLRLTKGDKFVLFNGEGGEYLAEITELGKGNLTALILNHNLVEKESSLPISLGLAAIKRDKMDFAIQKATELGVSSIYPLISEFSNIKSQVLEKRQSHWQGIVESACEQCGRNRLPELHPVQSLDDWLSVINATIKVICEPNSEPGNLFNSENGQSKPASLALLIGPEGGFSNLESSMARKRGFVAMGLGPRILRAETAVVSSLAILQSRWGDI